MTLFHARTARSFAAAIALLAFMASNALAATTPSPTPKKKKKKVVAPTAQTAQDPPNSNDKAVAAWWSDIQFEPYGEYSDSQTTQFFRSDDESQRVAALKWRTHEPSMILIPHNDEYRVFVKLEGKMQLLEWSLTLDGEKIPQGSDGSFSFELPIEAVDTVKQIEAHGPGGELDTEIFRVRIPHFENIRRGQIDRSAFRPSLEVSSIAFNQSTITPYNEIALTAKIVYDLPIPSKTWFLGVSAYGTLLPLSRSDASVTARYFGANVRFGYRTGILSHPWSLALLTGIYYTTMSVTNDEFGYKNLYGPQFYPLLSRSIGLNDNLQTYFKFSPVTDGFNVLTLSNRELALGFNWNHLFPGGHALTFNLNFANLKLNLDGKTVDSTSFSIGPGFEW
jgi:hypothetical protein